LILIPMSQEQYFAARGAIAKSSQVLTHAEATDWTGSFSTRQVAMSYRYDGTTLSLTVTAKYGMAKFASEEMIRTRLMELLSEVNA
jgi:hypothetical protein